MTNEPKKEIVLTAADVIAQIPPGWRSAQVCIGTSVGRANIVRRVALHRDASGRRVVVLYDEPIDVRIS